LLRMRTLTRRRTMSDGHVTIGALMMRTMSDGHVTIGALMMRTMSDG
jgi:hypothetical protein